LERYSHGERNFREANLESAHLEGAVLDGAMLDWANLQGAHLEGTSLRRTNFEGANLEAANLEGSNLEGANLNRARLEGADLKAVILVEANLERAYLVGANLKWANLRGAVLRRAVLRRAHFEEAHLDEAHLEEATLVESCLNRACLDRACLDRARLRGARLEQARLQDTILLGADLRGARLNEALLERTNLIEADLAGAFLTGASVSRVVLGGTLLVNIDLAPFCGAELSHFGPSTVDFAAVVQSVNCQNLKQFLRDTGLPQIFVDDMVASARTLTPSDRLSSTFSTFICYAGPDEPLAQRLHDALREDGVTSFYYSFDAKLGELNANVMHRRIREHDRVVILCSAASLARAGVRKELNEVRDRESDIGERSCIIPVAVDDYLFGDELRGVDRQFVDFLSERVVADFRQTNEDEPKFKDAVLMLEQALKRNTHSWPPPRQVSPMPPESRVTVRG
jgi:uncharacterized protein YjbI with pentapeptide repeats